MNLRKRLLRVLILLLGIFMLTLGLKTYAAVPFDLKIESYRKPNAVDDAVVGIPNGEYRYRLFGAGSEQRTIWKLTRLSGSTSTFATPIYCLKAEQGFFDASAVSGAAKTYTYERDMKDPLFHQTVNMGGYWDVDQATYYKVLWILINSYNPEYDSTAKKNNLLSKAGIPSNTKITQNDIDVVQQMAIWYFTNPTNPFYHNGNVPNPVMNALQVDEKGAPATAIDIDDRGRSDDIRALYKYFINNANNATSAVVNQGEATLSFDSTKTAICEMQTNGTTYRVGPYKIDQTGVYNSGTFNAVLNINGTPKSLSGYQLLKSDKVTTLAGSVANIESLIGQEFYILIPASQINAATTVNLQIGASYDKTKLTFYSALPANTTQPVVEITKEPAPTGDETEVTLIPWDLDITKIEAGNVQIKLQGVKFNVEVEVKVGSNFIPYYSGTNLTTDVNGKITIPNIIGVSSSDEIRITVTETATISGYILLPTPVVLTLKRNADGSLVKIPSTDNRYVLNDNTKTIAIILENYPEEPIFDLALRKYITQVNGVNVPNTRVPDINWAKINDPTPGHTADYKHRKDPVVVETGDIVTYAITVYNEGDIPGYVTNIRDYLPYRARICRGSRPNS